MNDLDDEINSRWCSWAGPADPSRLFGDADSEKRLVFASGMRGGRSHYDDGFYAVSIGGTSQPFLRFEDLARTHSAYAAGEPVIHYGVTPLEHVEPYPDDDLGEPTDAE